MKDKIIKNKEFSFSFNPNKCSECGAKCCKGESGYIFISSKEIKEISLFLKLSIEDFTLKYLKIVKNKYYSLRETKLSYNNYACVFLDLETNNCSIHDIKPKQCMKYPFWDKYKKDSKEVRYECLATIDL